MKATLNVTSATVDKRIGTRHAASSSLPSNGATGAQSVARREFPQQAHGVGEIVVAMEIVAAAVVDESFTVAFVADVHVPQARHGC